MATGKHTFFGSKKAISKTDQCYVLKRKFNPLNTQISSLILLTV